MASGTFTQPPWASPLLCLCALHTHLPQTHRHVTHPSNTRRCGTTAIFSCLGLSRDCNQVTAGAGCPGGLDIHGGPLTWRPVMPALAGSSSGAVRWAPRGASPHGFPQGKCPRELGEGSFLCSLKVTGPLLLQFSVEGVTSPPRVKRQLTDPTSQCKECQRFKPL